MEDKSPSGVLAVKPLVILSLVAVPLATAGQAAAQQDDVLFGLMKCDRIADPAERMACFDGLVGQYRERIVGEESAPEPAVVPTPHGWQPARPAPAAEAMATGSLEAAEEEEEEEEEDIRALDDEALRRRVESYYAAARGPQPPPRAPTVDDLPLPYETTVTAFVKSNLGDFKLRIKEGWMFKDSSGPPLQQRTLEGKTVVLDKNVFGQWRAKVDGEPGLVAITPVSR